MWLSLPALFVIYGIRIIVVMAGFVPTSTFLVRVGSESKVCSANRGKASFGRPRVSTRACISSDVPVSNNSTTLNNSISEVATNQVALDQKAWKKDSFDDPVEEETSDFTTSSEYSVAPNQDYVSVNQIKKSTDALSDPAYSSVVDVNITTGGVLGIEDEDNNSLFAGVGFDALIDNEKILENLEKEFSITTTTHVQFAAIPRIQEGEDVVIQGHTGTGKTLAFLLPLLEAIDTEIPAIQAMIIAPTRELAMQIAGECTRLCTETGIVSMGLIGGANPMRQVEKLRKRSPHVIIGTPGRLAELEESRAIKLKQLKMVVIDEVDQCIENPFRESIENLLFRCPRRRQLMFVSATGDVPSVRQFSSRHMNSPILLRVGDKQMLPKNISNWYVVVPPRLRIETIRKLMFAEPAPTKAICFVDDPRRTEIVLERLHKHRIAAAGLRGNADKTERAQVIKAFRQGRISLLVTTEIAARGLDVRDVSHVFNLDLPTDADHYVHRAGRCGRVGKEGVVVSVATAENAFVINRLQKQLKVAITRMEPRRGEYAQPIERSWEGDRKQKTRGRESSDKSKSEELTSEREAVEIENGEDARSKPKKIKEAAKAVNSIRKKDRSKKSKRSRVRNLPKHVTSNYGISRFAAENGWVGNRN